MKRVTLALVLAGLVWLAVSSGLARADRPADPSAPTVVGPVDCATFAPPVVAYDISKSQSAFDVDSFLNDLVFDGFSVGTISGSIPACVDVLIVRGISGTLGLPSPYTAAEAASMKSWVDAGHALMVSGDWGAYGAGTEAIFAAFGYSQGGPNALTDPNDFDPIGGSDWVIYQPDNFALHPILEGVTSVEFLRGSWLSPTTAAIITSDANSSPPSVPVMAAFASGVGCVVLSTDSDWMADALPLSRAGYFKRDNALMARQTVSWLNSCGLGPTARPGGPYTVNEGSSVMLSGAASSDPTGDPLTFAWDLDNDKQFDDAFVVNPIFSAALRDDGVYPVSLRVSDGTYTDTGSTYVTVLNVAPTVTLTASTTNVSVTVPITFFGSFFDPGVLDTHTIRWNFGDGSPQVFGLLTRTHAFNAAGAYTTTLSVTDNDGGVGAAMLVVSVNGAALTANAGGPYAVNEGSSILLNGSASNAAVTYAWDFDNDGQFDDATGPTPTFSAAVLDDGIYPVSLYVSDGALTATHSSAVTVLNVAPQVSLAATAWSITVGQVITFTGVFTDPGVLDTHTIQWDFGDGSPQLFGLLTRTHAFNAPGTYTVTLTVTDDDGGVGRDSLAIVVVTQSVTRSDVFLPLVMRNFCALTSRHADIVLTIDTSGSMEEPTQPDGPTKLDAAKFAATNFLNLLVFPGNQAAIVSFDTDAVLEHALSDDRAGLIAALQSLMAGGVTRMDLALALSRSELVGPRHNPIHSRIVIFLTDGLPNGTTEETVLAEANATKSQGITIYTIGLGSNVNASLLREIATSASHYYFSPSTTQLTEIYERIAGTLRCP